MKKPLAHIIDEEAVDLFRASLPKADWQIYDIQKDYAKDNLVELIEGGSQTGTVFCVQLKGKRAVRRASDGTIGVQLETKHIEYWTKVEIPVFLIVVNVTQRSGYWLFLQRYVRTQLDGVNWKAKRNVTVRLPCSNLLTDHGGLREAVKNACEYMNNLAFHTSIRREKHELEKLDPRIRVEIQVTPEGRHYNLLSDKPIALSFSNPDGSPSSGMIEDLLDRGLPVSVPLSEIEINGSPVISALHEKAGDSVIHLQWKRVFQGHVNILRQNLAGAEIGRFDAIPCTINCNRNEARIEARLPHAPDLLPINFVALLTKGEIASISMPVKLSAWVGHALLDLPFFDRIAAIFHAYEPGERLTLECYAPGTRLLSGRLDFVEQPPYPGVDLGIRILQKARAIARLEGINPLLPGNFNHGSTMREIDELYAILIGGGRRHMTPDARMSVALAREGLEDFLRESERSPEIVDLTRNGSGEFPFLGEPVAVPQLVQTVSHVVLVSDPSELRNDLDQFPAKEEFQLEFAGTAASETILRSTGKESRVGQPWRGHAV